MDWHRKEAEEVMAETGTSLAGLSAEEALKRFGRYGPNELIEGEKRSALTMFLDQFRDFMIMVLIAAAGISGFIGDLSDTLAIIVIIVLNAVMGFVQEYRAEKAMAALKRMAAHYATVIRHGEPSPVEASMLVPGDVVVVEAGMVVPADMRLVEALALKVDEAALTGESSPSEKHTKALRNVGLPVGDRKNMAYKGTFITYGRGKGVVAATGMNTELGRIAAMLQEGKEAKTPLQKRLADFGRKLAWAVLAICAVVFGIGVMSGERPLLMFLTAISLAVAAIPEALPAVVTISLALGAKKLAKQNALIRKLPAVETLGSVTYICSDKTGTLTQNRMTVEEIYAGGRLFKTGDQRLRESDSALLMTGLALSNDVSIGEGGTVAGDPTEIALYKAAADAGFEKRTLEMSFPRVAELHFDPERKCMTTFHKWDAGYISFTKGAADVLVESAVDILTHEESKTLDAGTLLKVNDEMAARGLRVLCLAMKKWDGLPDVINPENAETGLTVLGFAGMIDPPREAVREAVLLCRTAGIRPVMITGDHPATARAIAKRIGILDEGGTVITGRELEGLASDELEERIEHIRVFARVAPEQKLKIVRALQGRGHFVAMTGDGVNDAPALKRSDIGIAMGITGTDVAKEAAHMVLLDDNFAAIVKAVREGRKIYDNIRKFIKYLLTTNSGELWTLFLAPFAGLPVPLLPIHILWINLVTDGLPALALSAEPAERDIMDRPPRHPDESVFAHGLGLHAMWVGLLMGGVVLFLQSWAIGTGHTHWQTMVFTALCLTQIGHVMAIRSEKVSLFRMGLFSNKYLLGSVLIAFAAQMGTVYVPSLNAVFKTEPLSLNELLFTLSLSSIVFIAVEIEKLIKRRTA